MVTRSSSSQQLFFLVSRLLDLRIGFWPQKGHPKWSPGRSRMILLQGYRSSSTRSVFIDILFYNLFNAWWCFDHLCNALAVDRALGRHESYLLPCWHSFFYFVYRLVDTLGAFEASLTSAIAVWHSCLATEILWNKRTMWMWVSYVLSILCDIYLNIF